MEELLIEEKAKRYDSMFERLKEMYNNNKTNVAARLICERYFPELKECEDKMMIQYFKDLAPFDKADELYEKYGFSHKDAIAWLKKQEEQELNDDEDILQRFSFYSYKDEPNILYLSGLYVNEEYRNKGIGTKILEVADEVAKSLNCHVIRLKTKKGSNAERLYRTYGYNSLATEESDEIWLEKQGEKTKPIEGFNTEFERQVSCLIASAMNRDYEYTKDFVKWTSDALLNYAKLEIEKNSMGISEATKKKLEDNLNKALEKETPESFNKFLDEQGEQKPADKVEPKFYEGDIIIHKELGGDYIHNPHKIIQVDILDKKYRLEGGLVAHFDEQDDYELVEQKPAWSEEDIRLLNNCISLIEDIDCTKEEQNFLKSLRPRNTWKPSDEQMETLKYACGGNYVDLEVLESLYNDLKKLKDEK